MPLTRPPRPLLSRTLPAVLVASVMISACGDGAAGTASTPSTGATESSAGFPLTIENCGAQVTFEQPPQRVLLLNSAPVTSLQDIGVLDRVVARAGAYPEGYYDDATRAALADIPSLGEDLNDSGHLQISQEVIIAEQPDLVMGLPDGITRDALADAGIPVLEQPAFCPQGLDAPSFDDVYTQVESYGRVFGRQEAATAASAALRDRVRAIDTPDAEEDQRTAAVLFPTAGGGSVSAYGTKSMAHPQLEAAGFSNVFGDVDDRVFEITAEELIGRDPDVLVLLHSDGDPGPVKDGVLTLPGAEGLTAVRNDDILVQLFNFTEPPTPLSLDGLERVAERFGSSR